MADLLKTTTLYVVPCLNPDATEHFFAEPKIERTTNDTPDDEDHDGLTDEDGCEDLNGDGLITLMRVEDKERQYILDPNESRLLLKADPFKGEQPVWRLLPEGIDNDRDKRWNEDGPGGTNFNRNFPYGYKYFAADAGIHPVCEDETRALADFVVAHPNIGIVLTYGAADNLRKTPKRAASAGRSRPMDAISDKDIGYYEAFGKLYRARLGLSKELDGASEPGTFSDWMYFHRGRLSLAARPWDPALAVALAKPHEKGKENGARKCRTKNRTTRIRPKTRKARRETQAEEPHDANTPADREEACQGQERRQTRQGRAGAAPVVRRARARCVHRLAGGRASGFPRPAGRGRRLSALCADESAPGDAR